MLEDGLYSRIQRSKNNRQKKKKKKRKEKGENKEKKEEERAEIRVLKVYIKATESSIHFHLLWGRGLSFPFQNFHFLLLLNLSFSPTNHGKGSWSLLRHRQES